MANIASLAVSLTAYTSAFDKKMRKSRSTVRVFKSAVARVDKALLRIGVVAAAAAAAGLVLVTKNAFQSMDAIAKLSARIDVSTEFLVAYGHAATLAGTSSEEFSKAIEIFVRRLGELTQGTGEAKYGLEALGLNMKDMLAMNPEQAFAKVADGIKGLGTQAEKAAVAYRFFGRSGSKMLNLLESDTSDVFSKAEKLNILYSEFDAKKIQDANDAMANLKKMIGGVGQSIAIKVAPKITQMITAFLESGDAAQKLRNIVDKVIKKTIAFGKTALTILKWASAIYVGVKAASILIAVLKGVSVSMSIVQALGGPIGWASLAIGLTTAAAAGIAVKKSFDKVGDSIKGGMDDAKNSIDKMKASLEAAGKTKVDTIDTTALAEKAKAFDELATKAERLRESLKTPVEKFKEMREELDKMIQSKLISQQEYDKAINKYSESLLKTSDPSLNVKSYRSEYVDVTGLGTKTTGTAKKDTAEQTLEVNKRMESYLSVMAKREGLN